MFTIKNIFSSLFEKARSETEKKPIITISNPRRDYTTFDYEIITRTQYLLSHK
jgi:hypothetical protein